MSCTIQRAIYLYELVIMKAGDTVALQTLECYRVPVRYGSLSAWPRVFRKAANYSWNVWTRSHVLGSGLDPRQEL